MSRALKGMKKLNTSMKQTVSDFKVIVDTVIMVLYLEGLELESNLSRAKESGLNFLD